MSLGLGGDQRTNNPGSFLSHGEAADFLGCTPNFIEELVKSGELTRTIIGKRHLIYGADLARWAHRKCLETHDDAHQLCIDNQGACKLGCLTCLLNKYKNF
jgi:excisionase family DNA binding protein